MPVKKELTAHLYGTKLLELDKERDPSFGGTRGSKYDLFDDEHETIQNLALDLKKHINENFQIRYFHA